MNRLQSITAISGIRAFDLSSGWRRQRNTTPNLRLEWSRKVYHRQDS